MCITSKAFEEYWVETREDRKGYPAEILPLLKRHAWKAWEAMFRIAFWEAR